MLDITIEPLKLERINTVLIVSPHPDDDVIGAGGFIYIASKLGIKIKILYVTDGSGSLNPKYKNIVETRKQEAKNAINKLLENDKKALSNITYDFLGFKSDDLKRNPELLNPIFKLSKDYDLILLPHYDDLHKTHRVISRFMLTELKSKFINGANNTTILFYEVWGAVSYQNKVLYLDISKIIENKRLSILEHKSQNKILPFAEGILAKNKYNAIFKEINTLGKSRFVEFYEVQNNA